MAQIESWFKQDLNKPVQVQMIRGNVFSQDVQANKIGVEIFRDGEAENISGTITANVIRQDGGTVAVTGDYSENKAWVVLPAAAYAYPGQIVIALKVTLEGITTTLLAVTGAVYRTSTDTVVDPGTIIPSIEDLIDAIETAVASIPADYSSLWTSLAPAFSTSTAYVAGQYVTNSGKVWRFITNHSAGAWNSSHVTQVNIGNELTELKSAFELSSDVLQNANLLFIGTAKNTGTGATFWNSDILKPNNDTLYLYIKDYTGVSATSSDLVRVFITYTDTTTAYKDFATKGEWGTFTVNSANVSSISLRFRRSASNLSESVETTYTIIVTDTKPVVIELEEYEKKADAELDRLSDIVENEDNGIYVTNEATIVDKEQDKYIAHNGSISGYTGVGTAYSKPIQVHKDDYIVVIITGNPSSAAITYCDAYGESRTEAVACDSWNEKTYTLTSDRNGYIIISYVMAQPHKCYISHKVVKEIKEDIEGIEDILDAKTVITVEPKATGYITGNGAIVSSDAYYYSKPIPIRKGDKVTAILAAPSVVSVISYIAVDYKYIVPAVMGSSWETAKYTFTSEHTGWITICYLNDHECTCYIERNQFDDLRNLQVLDGKFAVWCGDSICWGHTWNDKGNGWASRVADLTGLRFKNYGVGGSTITNNVTGGATPTIYTQIETAHTEYPDADYIIFDGGCNDADLIGNATGSTKPAQFGTFVENDFSGVYDIDTFCGAFETICMHLSQYWLGKHVGYIIPHKMGVSNNYHEGVNNYRTYYETAIQICKKWGIQVLNLWDGCYLNPKHTWMCDTNNTMTPEQIYAAGFLYADRQHLTSAGYDYEGNIVAEWVKGL